MRSTFQMCTDTSKVIGLSDNSMRYYVFSRQMDTVKRHVYEHFKFSVVTNAVCYNHVIESTIRTK
jgi:uncharacterized membrane protein YagU involved in acid resistance